MLPLNLLLASLVASSISARPVGRGLQVEQGIDDPLPELGGVEASFGGNQPRKKHTHSIEARAAPPPSDLPENESESPVPKPERAPEKSSPRYRKPYILTPPDHRTAAEKKLDATRSANAARSRAVKAKWAQKSEAERKAHGAKVLAAKGPEKIKEQAEKASQTHARKSEAELEALRQRTRDDWAKRTPEQRKEIGRKISEAHARRKAKDRERAGEGGEKGGEGGDNKQLEMRVRPDGGFAGFGTAAQARDRSDGVLSSMATRDWGFLSALGSASLDFLASRLVSIPESAF